MNIQYLIQAVEALDEAAFCTPEKKEREEIEKAAVDVRCILQKRGVFIGKRNERKQ